VVAGVGAGGSGFLAQAAEMAIAALSVTRARRRWWCIWEPLRAGGEGGPQTT